MKIKNYRFLIIHNATVIQKIIQKFIAKMYDSEASVDLCLPEDRALKHIAEKKYNIVYSGLEMSGLNGFDIHEQLHLSTLNAKTPLVIMTASDSPRQMNRFKHRGIKYYLNIPCTFEQFHNITHVALNPEIPDKHMRFFIPKTQADIQVGERLYKANLTNIGMESMECDLLCPDETASLIQDCGINIRFPEQYGHERVQNLKGSLLRMSIKERLTSTMPQRLRTIWKFSFNGLEDQSGLARVINQAPKNSLDMYEDLDNIYEINEKLSQNNESLQEDVKYLQKENDRLLKKINELETNLSAAKHQPQTFEIKNVSLSSLINEKAKAANDPAKLEIFQRVIDDNVKLRKNST
ncbi:hypothetical protein MHK_010753 [Candidatus Magnetomorum sp. HK-1]|nr:hypothetical protein MHK_010753 [Candidatus Magnetomorum sp. HK-1]